MKIVVSNTKQNSGKTLISFLHFLQMSSTSSLSGPASRALRGSWRGLARKWQFGWDWPVFNVWLNGGQLDSHAALDLCEMLLWFKYMKNNPAQHFSFS